MARKLLIKSLNRSEFQYFAMQPKSGIKISRINDLPFILYDNNTDKLLTNP